MITLTLRRYDEDNFVIADKAGTSAFGLLFKDLFHDSQNKQFYDRIVELSEGDEIKITLTIED